MERRIWAQSGRYVTYPNLYVMLCAHPGVGKQVIDEARGLVQAVKVPNTSTYAFKLASDSVTRASLIDEIAKAKFTFQVTGKDAPLTHCSLTVMSEEFRVLLPAYDQDFISRLDKLYNGIRGEYRETRRTGLARDVVSENPLLNILAGAQPAYLADTFPENAWATGICRRLIMIHATESPIMSIFEEPKALDELSEELEHFLGRISQMYGHVRWSGEAAALVGEFDLECQRKILGQQLPETGSWRMPNHTRLVHYNRSRTMFVIKLSIVAALASRCEMEILECDVQRALGWLLDAESHMPDIFREMRGRSDYEVMIETHRYALACQAKDRGHHISGGTLIKFLSERVPGEKVERLFALMERSDMLARVAGTTDKFVPKPIFEFKGVE